MDSQTHVMSAWRSSATSTPKLDEAMAMAQGEIEAAPKDATNPHLKSTYADLSSIIGVARPVLAKHKIARYQPVWTDDKPGVNITTRLACGGEWVEADLRMPVNKNDAQAVGSAITYGKRYGLAAMLGIATVDDDGEGATASPPVDRPKPAAKAKPTPKPAEQPHADEPRDDLGPRCNGKAAGISKSIGERMRTMVETRGGKAADVWADVLAEAGIDVSKYGRVPRSEALTVPDGTAVRDYLIRVLDPPPDMDALRSQAGKLWVRICQGPDGLKLDDWQAEWAGFAQIERWPDQPSAADLQHAIAGMTHALERMAS
jgi:hypothetical protein